MAIHSSPFFSCPQPLPASGSFPMNKLFASSAQSTGVCIIPSKEIPGLISFRMDWLEPLSQLIITCKPLDQHLISHAMIIYSGTRSSPQPLDLCLLSPMTSAYSAMRSAPDSHLINDYQPLDQHLSTTLSSPFSCWISACYPLSHGLISCIYFLNTRLV